MSDYIASWARMSIISVAQKHQFNSYGVVKQRASTDFEDVTGNKGNEWACLDWFTV